MSPGSEPAVRKFVSVTLPHSDLHETDVTIAAPVEKLLWRLVALSLLVLPLTAVPGKDAFRMAKELFFLGEGLLVGAILTIALIIGGLKLPALKTWLSIERALPVAILLWTAVAALFSSNRLNSIRTLAWVTAGIAIYGATALTIRKKRENTLWLLLIPAAINSVLALAQILEVWNPFRFASNVPIRDQAIGFLGNPDDVGTYIVVPALAAFTMAFITRGARRGALFVCGVVITTTLLVCQLATATVALAAGLIGLGVSAGRDARRLLLATAIVATVVTFSYAPTRQRVVTIANALRIGNFGSALSSRLEAVIAATEMFLRHPVVGVGPGTFGFNYFDYKIALDAKYAWRLPYFNAVNFGEVHDDHLQILATTGVPGYILMLGSFAAIGRRSWLRRYRHDDTRRTFARLFSFPFVICVFTLALAQFPLELGAPLSVIITFAAICVTWS